MLLRVWLQWARADFYNPMSQMVVKLTNPLVVPLRRVIPGFGGLDMASVLLALLIAFGKVGPAQEHECAAGGLAHSLSVCDAHRVEEGGFHDLLDPADPRHPGAGSARVATPLNTCDAPAH